MSILKVFRWIEIAKKDYEGVLQRVFLEWTIAVLFLCQNLQLMVSNIRLLIYRQQQSHLLSGRDFFNGV